MHSQHRSVIDCFKLPIAVGQSLEIAAMELQDSFEDLAFFLFSLHSIMSLFEQKERQNCPTL